MRVIAGTARGTRLKAPPGGAVRPTADRVKEALFNILGPRLPGAVVWDLCAGSGAIGIEALSRGAARAIFVEMESAHLRMIAENLARTKLAHRARLICREVAAALSLLSREGEQADLIFSDPPYQERIIPGLLQRIEQQGLLRPGGLLVLELFTRTRLWPAEHPLVSSRKYGDTVLTFIEAAALPGARAALDGAE